MPRVKSGAAGPVGVTYQKGKGFKKMIGWNPPKGGERQPRI
jgi:hypothetical protein